MEKNNFHILWVTPKWTLPIEDGARLATKAILQPLIKLNPTISYLALAGEDEVVDENKFKAIFPVKNIFIIRRSPHTSGLRKYFDALKFLLINPFFPVTFSRYQLSAEVEPILKKHHFDLIIADGLHAAVPFLPLNSTPLILRAHNVEKDLWKRSFSQTKNPLKKIFFAYQAKLVKDLELKVISRAVKTFAISHEDQQTFSQLTGKKINHLPVGQNFKEALLPMTSTRIQLLFLGKLDWAPNQDGLKWFLDEVWPKLSPDRFHLTIAGSGKADWLKHYHSDSITFLGRVPDVKTIYEKNHLVIIPIFYGSGTRIKVLEASRFQRACIGTISGMTGSPLVNHPNAYFPAETASEWMATLNSLTDAEINDKAKVAFQLCSQTLDENKVAEQFLTELKTF